MRVLAGVTATGSLPELHLLQLETRDLAAGSYLLELTFGDVGDGGALRTQAGFLIPS